MAVKSAPAPTGDDVGGDLDLAVCAAALVVVVVVAPRVPVPEVTWVRVFTIVAGGVAIDALARAVKELLGVDVLALPLPIDEQTTQRAATLASDARRAVGWCLGEEGRPRARPAAFHAAAAVAALCLAQAVAHGSVVLLVLLAVWAAVALPRIARRFPVAARASVNLVSLAARYIPTAPVLDGKAGPHRAASSPDDWVMISGRKDMATGKSRGGGGGGVDRGGDGDGDGTHAADGADADADLPSTPDSGRDRGWSLLDTPAEPGDRRERGWSLILEDTPAPAGRRPSARSALSRTLSATSEEPPSDSDGDSRQRESVTSPLSRGLLAVNTQQGASAGGVRVSKLDRGRGWSLLSDEPEGAENATPLQQQQQYQPRPRGRVPAPTVRVSPTSVLFSDEFDLGDGDAPAVVGTSTPAAARVTRRNTRRGTRL